MMLLILLMFLFIIHINSECDYTNAPDVYCVGCNSYQKAWGGTSPECPDKNLGPTYDCRSCGGQQNYHYYYYYYYCYHYY